MKNKRFTAGILSLTLVFGLGSCLSMQDRQLSRDENPQVLGTVSDTFTSFQLFHFIPLGNVKNRAYSALLEKAKEEYGNDVDVKNIQIKGKFSFIELANIAATLGITAGLAFPIGDALWAAGLPPYSVGTIGGGILIGGSIGGFVSGNTQKIVATGDVISRSGEVRPVPRVTGGGKEGVYIGIITFAGDARDITNGPILLDAAGQGKDTLISKLNSDYVISSQSGTAIFYAVHKALSNLKRNESQFPANLDSVNVVTFTDGLDNASDGRLAASPLESQSFDSPDKYAAYINSQLATRTISGRTINAYSIGVRGGDVTDIPKFRSNLASIAGTGNRGSHNELTDFSSVQSTFNDIARKLNVIHSATTFTLVTTLLSSGTKVRMTFDSAGFSDPGRSSKYLEGTITRTGTAYTFGSIAYAGGLGSAQGAGPITGTVNGSEVNFAFTAVNGYNQSADEAATKQWLMAPGSANWQVNSEYSTAGNTNITVEQKSAVIYLVLDASTSLNHEQIAQIRQSAISFIENLYSQITNTGVR